MGARPRRLWPTPSGTGKSDAPLRRGVRLFAHDDILIRADPPQSGLEGGGENEPLANVWILSTSGRSSFA